MKFIINDDLEKARKLHGRRLVHGMQISVENRAGSVRRWFDPHGNESGSTKMKYDYGYIRGTEGADDEHIDCYVGPYPSSPRVFIVNQMKKPDFKEFDEQKVMLGFTNAEAAKRAYLAHYNDERFFGDMIEMTIDRFKLLAFTQHEQILKAMAGARQVAIHKYKSRRPDGKGGWIYEYDTPEKTTGRTGALVVSDERVRALSDRMINEAIERGSIKVIATGDAGDDTTAVRAEIDKPSTFRDGGISFVLTRSDYAGKDFEGSYNPHRRILNVDMAAGTMSLTHVKREVRRVLAHELTHTVHAPVVSGAATQRIRDDQADDVRAARGEIAPPKVDSYTRYRNYEHEVTAKIAEMHRDLTDKRAVAALRRGFEEYEKEREQAEAEEDPADRRMSIAWVEQHMRPDPIGWAYEHSLLVREEMHHYDEKNKKRIHRAIADLYEAVREGRVKPIEKGVITIGDLRKAAGKPPGSGWQSIPGGRRGGYRKPDGHGGWTYWYPGHEETKPQKRASKWTEEEFATGTYDKNPLHWHEPAGKRAPWTSGGVDVHSAHPVKYAGRFAKLYRIAAAQAPGQEGYAVLVDVETGERMLADHNRIRYVEYAPERIQKPRQQPTPEKPRWEPGTKEREPGFNDGDIGVSGERAPKFTESHADPAKQPGLYAIENGVYPLKSVERIERDDDGVLRTTKQTRIAVPDHGKHQLVQEFEALIASTAKSMQRRFGLRSEWEVSPDGTKRDLALLDLRRAGVEGLLAAIEHYDARGPFAATAQQFVRDHVRLSAARDALGGIGLPVRHQRNLARFIAARAKAASALNKDDPSVEDVLPFFALKKRHLHSDLSNDIGNQPVPVEDYHLRSGTAKRDGTGPTVEEDTVASPGLRSLATLYHDFITGAKSSEEFSEDKFTLPGLGIGAELRPEERILARNAISRAMKTLDEVSITTEGRKKITYTTDVSEILMRKLGIFARGEAQSDAEIARDIPIFSNGKKVAENSARALVAQFVEKGLAHLRGKLDDEKTKKLIERAEERLVPPVIVKDGPTWWEVVATRAKAVPASAVERYRAQEAERMRTQSERMRTRAREVTDENTRKTQMGLADALEQAAQRAERMPEAEVRQRIAMQASPETAEMRKLATQSIAIDVHKPGSYERVSIEMTDPATGAQRVVSVRKLTDLKSKWDAPISNPLHKSDAASKLHASMMRDLLLYPRLMRLLFAPEDAVGAAPTLARYVTETLAGVV